MSLLWELRYLCEHLLDLERQEELAKTIDNKGAAPKKGAARRSPKPAAATPRSPPKPKTGAPASPRPSDVPNGSLKYNQENPKKRGSKSWHRYESYKRATTVDEYFRLQGTLGDLKYDFSRGFFKAPPALARWCASK